MADGAAGGSSGVAGGPSPPGGNARVVPTPTMVTRAIDRANDSYRDLVKSVKNGVVPTVKEEKLTNAREDINDALLLIEDAENWGVKLPKGIEKQAEDLKKLAEKINSFAEKMGVKGGGRKRNTTRRAIRKSKKTKKGKKGGK